MAIVSFVTGILSFTCIFFTGIPAIITGIMVLKRSGEATQADAKRGFAIAGIVCGAIGTVLGTIFGLAMIAGLGAPLIMNQRAKAESHMVSDQMNALYQSIVSMHSRTGQLPSETEMADRLSSITLPQSRANRPWLYFPQASMSTPGDPLLASPPTGLGKCILLHTDGRIDKDLTPSDLADAMDRATSGSVEIQARSSH